MGAVSMSEEEFGGGGGGGSEFGYEYEAEATSINQMPTRGPSGPGPMGPPPPNYMQPGMGSPSLSAPMNMVSGMASPMHGSNPPAASSSTISSAAMMVPPVSAGAQVAQSTPYVTRSRIYAFVVDELGNPIELGSGRFAKAYLGEERWVESKTTLRRPIAIKCLQRGVSPEDQMRFQMEKEILERVQGHPNIVELLASGEGDSPGFVPPQLRDRVENDFMILELLDMSLEERLKGARQKRRRDDLLSVPKIGRAHV